jgi:polyphosphate glucokinase
MNLKFSALLESNKYKKVLGLDIGGSGIKGAIINTKTGKMLTPRFRIPTPEGATPKDVANTVKEVAKHFKWKGLIGCGFPSVIQNGFARTAANVDKSFIDTNVDKLFSETTGCKVFCVNDADAAGLAEMKYGVGKGQKGVVILITVGTGIGSVIFSQGKLVPNSEFGHVQYKGMDAEHYASDAVRKSQKLSWEAWALRFNEYLMYMENLFWPDLFIIGGGVSKEPKNFMPHLTVKCKVLPAKLQNNAGMIGAAVFAKQKTKIVVPPAKAK